MTSLSKVLPQPYSIIHAKFVEDRLLNTREKLRNVIFKEKPVDRDPGDDVIMTSLNRLQLDPYINNPTKFGEDRM